MTIGWVYVAVTESFPGDCKVGFTLRSVPERMKELQRQYRTRHPFTAYESMLVKNPRRVEWLAHRRLAQYRNPRTELFECPPAMARTALLSAIDQVIEEERRNPSMTKPRPERAPNAGGGRGTRRKQGPWRLWLAAVAVLIIAVLVRFQPEVPDWLPEPAQHTAALVESWR